MNRKYRADAAAAIGRPTWQVPSAKPTAKLSMRCELLGGLVLIGVGVARANGIMGARALARCHGCSPASVDL